MNVQNFRHMSFRDFSESLTHLIAQQISEYLQIVNILIAYRLSSSFFFALLGHFFAKNRWRFTADLTEVDISRVDRMMKKGGGERRSRKGKIANRFQHRNSRCRDLRHVTRWGNDSPKESREISERLFERSKQN